MTKGPRHKTFAQIFLCAFGNKLQKWHVAEEVLIAIHQADIQITIFAM